MEKNNTYIETTKKQLEKQADSALESYDSSQDSLDKAYMAILFGNIAFYATKLKSGAPSSLILDLLSICFMGLALIFILLSFMFSKSMMRTSYETALIQISLLSEEEDDDTDLKSQIYTDIDKNLLAVDKQNARIEYLNWLIPFMVLFSAIMCFLKAEFTPQELLKYEPYWLLFCIIFIVFAVIISQILRFLRKQRQRPMESKNNYKTRINLMYLIIFGAIIGILFKGDRND